MGEGLTWKPWPLEAVLTLQAAGHVGQVRPGSWAQAPAPLQSAVQHQGDVQRPGL